MMQQREIVPEGKYLVFADTHKRVVFYECDPAKNTECDRRLCRIDEQEDEGGFGFCSKTINPAFRKDGGAAWYAVLKPSGDGEPYWGREYIKEV